MLLGRYLVTCVVVGYIASVLSSDFSGNLEWETLASLRFVLAFTDKVAVNNCCHNIHGNENLKKVIGTKSKTQTKIKL